MKSAEHLAGHYLTTDRGVTAPRGFLAAGVHAGLKRKRKDVALIVSQTPAVAAGTFTTNQVKAAPVVLSAEHLKAGQARAIVANSGNANACNGERGYADARRMAEYTAELLGIRTEEVLVASTGVIGLPLPMDKVEAGIRSACQALSPSGGDDAAEAILTTDTRTKQAAVEFDVDGVPVRIGGMAKGSGMIHPNMATMLAFLTTDAAADPVFLQEALTRAVDETFNMISVDGDTSTNDMVLMLANGQADNPTVMSGSRGRVFSAALRALSHQMRLCGRRRHCWSRSRCGAPSTVAPARSPQHLGLNLKTHLGRIANWAASTLRVMLRRLSGRSLFIWAMYGSPSGARWPLTRPRQALRKGSAYGRPRSWRLCGYGVDLRQDL